MSDCRYVLWNRDLFKYEYEYVIHGISLKERKGDWDWWCPIHLFVVEQDFVFPSRYYAGNHHSCPSKCSLLRTTFLGWAIVVWPRSSKRVSLKEGRADEFNSTTVSRQDERANLINKGSRQMSSTWNKNVPDRRENAKLSRPRLNLASILCVACVALHGKGVDGQSGSSCSTRVFWIFPAGPESTETKLQESLSFGGETHGSQQR